ncbi:MAG: hypothetical protein HYY14_02450 [Candidatus Omnitrophica bacterium]|nr:hypothetical protein [Candidatus Omnitrophota bacterium]
MKRIAVIPALLGSTRIPEKNLLLVDGAPMVFYAASACRASGIFDEIYINSEHDIFGKIAEMVNVKFYRRRPDRGGSRCTVQDKSHGCQGERCQRHDHYLCDFMQDVGPCLLGMVNTTSPLIQPATVRSFMEMLEQEGYDSLFSVEERYAESCIASRPLNFSLSGKTPSQKLEPVQIITWSLTGWRSESFVESYRNGRPGEPGPTFCGKMGLFPMNRVEALDTDTQDDLFMVEACLRHSRQGERPGPFYFSEGVVGIEPRFKDPLVSGGASGLEGNGAALELSNLKEISRHMGSAPWVYFFRSTGNQQIALICQANHEPARKRCLVTHSGWEIVLEGEFEWRTDNGKVIKAGPSDVVCLPRGTVHTIVCTSKTPGIRLACGAHDMEYVYVK